MTDLEILKQIKKLALQLHNDPHASDFEEDEHKLAVQSATLLVERLYGVHLNQVRRGVKVRQESPQEEESFSLEDAESFPPEAIDLDFYV